MYDFCVECENADGWSSLKALIRSCVTFDKEAQSYPFHKFYAVCTTSFVSNTTTLQSSFTEDIIVKFVSYEALFQFSTIILKVPESIRKLSK